MYSQHTAPFKGIRKVMVMEVWLTQIWLVDSRILLVYTLPPPSPGFLMEDHVSATPFLYR